MPAARPRASFEPIPPDFDVRTFVETADNFQYVDRISYEMIANNGIEQFEKLVLLHVIIGGKPLVIDGFEEVLDPWTFTPQWLRDNQGDKVENARNLTTKDNIPLTIKHYLKHMGKLTDQFFDAPERYRDKTRQRIYLKDTDCPPVWQDKLKDHIPSGLYYLNESTGEIGGPGAPDEPGFRKGRGIGRAGDLMSSLPPDMRAENLMCYIGHEGTYTPSHREMCASLGQNIMVNASGNISEDGKPERPGSSIWFMTETKDRRVVSEYWLSVLGHDIEVENHFAQLIAWKKAPFKTYVVEQRPGDFILIPPLAPHQVWNRGTRTMKIAWNRTTVETLEFAMSEALPNSRIVCRDEQYKNKAIIYYSLLKYSHLIRTARAQVELGGEQAEAIQRSLKVRQVQRDFKRLFDLYKNILLSEMFAPDTREHCEFVPYDSNVTCAYCRCNVFNRFLTCKACKHAFSKEIEEPYDICMDCYAMGRSCACQSGYTWTEQWKWKDLIHKYEEWRAQIIDIDGQMTEKTPLPLQEERRYWGKKTLAQVCQEQLRIRPFVDPNAPQPVEDPDKDEEEDVLVDEYGRPKKKKRNRDYDKKNKSCHFCLNRHPRWKMAFCTNCDLAYCYGTLFRAHDMMPLDVMEVSSWKCPHCRRVCNTGNCRRDPRQHPYEPKGTLLGHDTKKVADPRSVEVLVDFSVSNLNWLKEDDVTGINNGPMQHRRSEAERAKLDDPTLDDRYMDEDEHIPRNGITYSPVEDTNGGFNDNLPGPSNPFANDGSGFIDPATAQYQPDDIMQDNGFDSYYPDPDANGEIPRLGKRSRDDDDEGENSRRKKKRSKKKKDEPAQPAPPKNVSGKQYQKEIQRKLLEEAKKKDRFILVAAKMKNKSKVVRLALSSDLLEAVSHRVVPERPQVQPEAEEDEGEAAEPTGNDRSILQSDILPKPTAASKAAEKAKAPNTFYVRVTDDGAYGARRPDKGPAKGKVGRPGQRKGRYEEIRVDSDEEEDDDDMVEYSGPSNGRPKGRSSAWLARKNEGEEDLPTELPDNFRDGQVNPRSEQDRERARQRNKERAERRKTMPEKGKAGIRLPGRPSRKSTGNMSDEDAIHEEDDNTNEALLLAQSAAAALEASRKAAEDKAKAEAAAREAEENMRAKMAIWNEDEDIDEPLNGFIDDFAAGIADEAPASSPQIDKEPTPEFPEIDSIVKPGPAPAPTLRNGPPTTSNSILSRPGMNGKKIKIVAAGAKKNGETRTTTTTTASFKAVNANANSKASKQVDLSDSSSDGEDEIPAKAPEPKTPLGRPVGRPSMVPTRGGTGKRGRGRGRGRPRLTM